MKRVVMIYCAVLLLAFSACKSGKPKKDKPAEKTEAQVILDEIDEIHIQGMSKMAKLTGLRQQVTKILDSVKAGTKAIAVFFNQKLDSSLQSLTNAEVTMDKWMNDFYRNIDTLSENATERVKYLTAEKLKATNLRDAILNSIQKADSVLKAKF
ncbi:MAG: hypothetical protein HZB42_10770 [Sphingobacteriales bacterium]|nr:hypothetical protein [Sphingobacteriales bacterium]